MNPEFKGNGTTAIEERTLELVSKHGYSTRKAKRQAEREYRIKWKKIDRIK